MGIKYSIDALSKINNKLSFITSITYKTYYLFE